MKKRVIIIVSLLILTMLTWIGYILCAYYLNEDIYTSIFSIASGIMTFTLTFALAIMKYKQKPK